MSGSTGRASGDVDELIDTVERWLSGGGPLLQPHEKETLRQISQRLGAVRTPQKPVAPDEDSPEWAQAVLEAASVIRWASRDDAYEEIAERIVRKVLASDIARMQSAGRDA